jgi:phosphoglycerol geranylgeranyltransferase
VLIVSKFRQSTSVQHIILDTILANRAIYEQLKGLKSQGQSAFAVLADPDKTPPSEMEVLGKMCQDAAVDYLLIGGSLLLSSRLEQCIEKFKQECEIPVILFPGSPAQVTPNADALLYLSLLSGRNADLLIGQHVASAASVKASGLEVISTGYILVDGGCSTTVSYMSGTLPIPADKPGIALCTAWAGEMLGMKLIYLEAGSGARNPITKETITMVSSQISIPLIAGGGIRSAEKVFENCKAGANLIVVGNAIEKSQGLIFEMASAVKEANKLP